MINPEKLLAYAIPDGAQQLNPKDSAFYALSLGLGQDPTDERQLVFVDHRRYLRAFPTLPLILAPSGFWIGDPATGIDATRLVHGEQAIMLHTPMPVEGCFTSKTRIVDLVDKGAGKGALLYLEKTVLNAASGVLHATCASTLFLRGNGGFNGVSRPAPPVAGLPGVPPDFAIDLPTRPEQALYHRLNGDENPIHADPAVAAKAGFDRPVLHGLCTFGLCARAVLQALCDLDPLGLARIALRFSGPVYPGETIRTLIWRSGHFQAEVVARGAVVARGGSFALAEGTT